MTTVMYEPANFRLRLTGHAKSAESMDPICAGASALAWALVEAATERADYRASLQIEPQKPEIDVRGEIGEDAWFMIDKYLDEAQVASIHSVTIIHGKGTGALRAAIWNHLKKDSRVSTFRAGVYGEGDYGVTVVELK